MLPKDTATLLRFQRMEITGQGVAPMRIRDWIITLSAWILRPTQITHSRKVPL